MVLKFGGANPIELTCSTEQIKYNLGRVCCQPSQHFFLDAGGIWGCSVFLGDERFAYGNILECSFSEIWNGARRRDSLAWCAAHFDIQECRLSCRMDPVNAYLWELAHPGGHDNFI